MDSSAFPEADPEIVSRRATSFGGQAAAYAQERPDYPDAAVEWALAPVADRSPVKVLDLGAGTGKLTEVILRHRRDVVAVEPDAAMRAELRRTLPEATVLEGSAERIPLPDASVDAILVGQALHWFDLDRAIPEMARVLSSGGVVAGLWNMDDDRVPWVAGYKDVCRSQVSFKRNETVRMLPPTPYFGEVELAEFPHAQRRTAESLTATVGTHSHVLILPDDERAKVLGTVLGYLKETPETAEGDFDLPIVTRTGRMIRN